MNKIENYIPIMLSFYLIFIYFYLINSVFPLWVDDYSMANIGIIESSFNFSKIKLIYNSMIARSAWNPRIGELLAVVFVSFNKIYYNIFIALVNVTFILLVFFYSLSRWPFTKTLSSSIKDVFIIFLIFLLYLYISPNVLESTVWLAGAMNHLFGNTLLLLLFLPYYYLLMGENIIKDKIYIWVSIIFLYYIASWNVQTSVPVFIGCMILAMIYYFFKYRKIYIWSILGVISSSIGLILLATHKSMNARMQVEGISISYMDRILNFPQLYVNSFKSLRMLHLDNLFYMMSIICIVYFLYRVIRLNFKICSLNIFLVKIILFIILFFASISILIFSPYIAGRQTVLYVFFVLCFFVSFFKLLDSFYDKKYCWLSMFVLLISLPLQKNVLDIYFTAKSVGVYTSIRNNKLIDDSVSLNAEDTLYIKGPFLGNIMPEEANSKNSKKNYFLTEWFDKEWYINSLREFYNIKQKIELDN